MTRTWGSRRERVEKAKTAIKSHNAVERFIKKMKKGRRRYAGKAKAS